MSVIVARTAGFCFGVQRAVDTVYKQIETGVRPIYTFGPIIHNEEVVGDLEDKGVNVIHSLEELETLSEGTVIIRSHGVSRYVQEIMEKQGLNVVDATCPFVKKIHRTAAEASEKGRHVVIIGDPTHPEVQGIKGWCLTEPEIISEIEEIDGIDYTKPITVVSQTTFNYKKFQEMVEKLEKNSYDIIVVNTICNATQERQEEARKVAASVEQMIVVGGRHSSNTRKLYDICKAECQDTLLIQTSADLSNHGFTPARSVGITAGASTPNKIIEEVHTYVRSKL